MKKLYEKYIRRNMFNKMLLIYTVITITAIFLLSYVFINYYIDNELQNEHKIHSEVTFNIEKRFEEQNSLANSVVNGINTQPRIVEEISILVGATYEEYLNYKLDNFTVSGGKNVDLKYVIDTILSNRKDALAVVINDKNHEFKREIVLNHDTWYDIKNSKGEYPHVRKITKPIKNMDTMYTVGYIEVFYDLRTLDKILEGSNIRGDLVVLDQNNNIAYNSNKSLTGEDVNRIFYRNKNDKYSSRNIFGSMDVNCPVIEVNEDSKNGFKFISIIEKNDLDTTNLVTKIIFVSMLCIVAILSITYIAIHRYSNKLKKMISGISRIKKGEFEVQIDVESEEDELDTIALSINEMNESLQFYIDNHYISYVRQKEAELSALQAQIKPHFLFNTLEVIRMYALTSKNIEVAGMIFNLANMFRYSTYDNGSMVTLNDEIKHSKMYLDLCCSRYKGLMSYKINIDENILKYKVPKFLLQPILENSINHGIDKSYDDNLIIIDIVEVDDSLDIVIKDNGVGMDEDTLNETKQGLEKNLQKDKSIGLMNINSRLKLKYGPEYGIKLESKKGIGTLVNIKLPIISGEDENV